MDTDELRHFVEQAGFIFRGRISPHGPPDAPAIPADTGDAVVAEIVEVLHSTEALRGLAGREAIVVTRHAATLRERHSLIMFTDCVSLGQQILLREIGHAEASTEASREVAEALRETVERPLRERIGAADLIATGEVIESRPLEPDEPPRSEHDPDWWIARLTVASVLKGGKPRGAVEVLFANSTDIVWYRSPKLHRGTTGIFLLHRLKQEEVPKAAPRAAYQATDPLDFLPSERLGEVEHALGSDRGR
jgi:hypothetical protein